MAETKEEQFARLHAKFGKKPEADTKSAKDGGKDANTKDTKGDSKPKRGRPKKTNADRHQDEIDTGRRTAGRKGTGDFLGGRSGDSKPKAKKMLAAPNATRLADKVMAGSNMAGGVAGSFMPSPTGPVPAAPPMPNGRQQTLTKVLAASGGGGGLSMSPPSGGGGLFMSPPTAAPPGLVMPRPSLPPIDFERDVAIPPAGASVGMEGASAGGAPTPRKVKTVSIPGAEPKMPTSASERQSGKPKLKPKSSKDKLADQISKDTGSSKDDYYEQLKRGQFNLSK